MKKKIALLGCLIFTMAANAQVTWNVKGGAGMAVSITNANVDPKMKFVAKLGAGIETPLTPDLSLMPSLEVALKGGKYDLKDYSVEKANEQLSLTYLQIPVLLAYRVNLSGFTNMTIKAGPYLAYALSGKLKGESSHSSTSYDVDIFSEDGKNIIKKAKRFDWGLDAGIDFEFRRFVAGVEYELGFLSMAPNDVSIKNQAFYLTVGYKF